MSNLLYKKFFVVLFAMLVSGCAPGLGKSLDIDVIDGVKIDELYQNTQEINPKVSVLTFNDIRSVDAVAQIEGRFVKPSGDVGQAVQHGFERLLKANGIELMLFDVPVVRGEVREWNVQVSSSFPLSKLVAVAKIAIELLDTSSNVVHKGIYTGSFEQQHPFVNESKIQSALAEAMQWAMREAVSDPEFIARITSLQTRDTTN